MQVIIKFLKHKNYMTYSAHDGKKGFTLLKIFN